MKEIWSLVIGQLDESGLKSPTAPLGIAVLTTKTAKMMFLETVFPFCFLSVLYATSGEKNECIFAKPGTPYHSKGLCTMEDISAKKFENHGYTEVSLSIAMILDYQNKTNVAGYHKLRSTDDNMPKKPEPDFEHTYFVSNVASFLGEEWVNGLTARWRSVKSGGYMRPEVNIHEVKTEGGTIEKGAWFLKPLLTCESTNFYWMGIGLGLGPVPY